MDGSLVDKEKENLPAFRCKAPISSQVHLIPLSPLPSLANRSERGATRPTNKKENKDSLHSPR